MSEIPIRSTRPAKSLAAVCLALLLFAPIGHAGARARSKKTALDRYVFIEDPSYQYKLVNTVKGSGATSYILDLVSQEWRRPAEVDRTRWQHWLTLIVPDQVQSTTAFLLINGGSNGRQAPRGAQPLLAILATRTKTVVADLRMVPNEPLTFKDENRSRTEDEIIAYSWDKYLRTGEENWPLRLPMTKSVVRAMDAVTAFCADEAKVAVDKFFVAGGSKRGWTAWTTAAVDDRVVAVAPFVIDVLNLEKSMEHHYRAYGFWAPAIKDYTDMRIMDWAGTAQYKALMRIEDPYSYRDRLAMPKLIVNSAGDQYFLPDSSQFYFEELKGEKHLRYVPNTKHDLNNSDALTTLQAFYESIILGTPRPRYSWKFEKDGSIVAIPVDKPTEVRLWQATNSKARDFRLDTIGAAFRSSLVEPDGVNRYTARIEKPAEGWTAFFVEMTFATPRGLTFKFTSGVRVTPESYPSPPPAKK